MGRLEQITGPADLRGLDDRALAELASEIRDELIRTWPRAPAATSAPTWAWSS